MMGALVVSRPTHLAQLLSCEPRIYRIRGKSRDVLKERVSRLRKERRRREAAIEGGIGELRDRLADALSRHALLDGGE